MKRKPTGYVAVCQCGFVVGAMDKDRTASDEASRLLGRWLSSGCTVKPMFDHSWRTQIEQCQCDDAAVQQSAQAAADARDAGRWRYALASENFAVCKWESVFGDPSHDWVPISEPSEIDAALATHQQGGSNA